MSLVDQVCAFGRVLASRLSNGEPVYNVAGIAEFAGFGSGAADLTDSKGEQASDQVGYASLGTFGRPLPPNADGEAEVVALRTDNALNPIGWRDLRLYKAINANGSGGAPADGQTGTAGYGGGMLTHAQSSSASGSRIPDIGTWYLPYQFDGSGLPTKALTISLNPVDQSISILHSDGPRIDLLHDTGNGPGMVFTVDGSTFCRLTAGEFTVSAAKIMLKGNVYVGREAEAGCPLYPGPISPPCPSLFLSPV